MAYDWLKDLGKSFATSMLALAPQLIINNQNVKNAQGQANDARDIASLQYQTALANAQAMALAGQAGGKTPKAPPKSNLPLYIGLGVGGVVLLGVVIFAVTRK
jgi:hypothetical protein